MRPFVQAGKRESVSSRTPTQIIVQDPGARFFKLEASGEITVTTMNHLRFTREALDLQQLCQLVGSPTCEGISLLTAKIRGTFDEEAVAIFDYNTYKSVGLQSSEKICGEIRAAWPSVENIAIFHSWLEGDREVNIGVAISALNGKDVSHAVERCMEEVTINVPIWKNEVNAKQASERNKKRKAQPHPPRIIFFKTDLEPQVQVSPVPRHLVQIHASSSEINRRIEDFMAKKRDEINRNNVREFTASDSNSEFSCARVNAALRKRPDSKGHLQVNRILNAFWKDQRSTEYLTKHIPRDGVEERLRNLEMHLNVPTPMDATVYTRLNNVESRLREFQGISPEYLQFWQFWNRSKTADKPVKKKVWAVQDLGITIDELQKKVMEEKR